MLEAAGFTAYEVSNHARGPAARARHNLVYWRGEDYVGVGPSAHGRLSHPAGRLATEAHARVGDYIAGVEAGATGWARSEAMGATSTQEERVLMGLRTDEGVRLDQLDRLPVLSRTGELLDSGLLRRDGARLYATPAGRLVLDGVTAALLA